MKKYGEKSIPLGFGIAAHPHIVSGAACLDRSRLSVAWLVGRFMAGETAHSIAAEYGIETQQIEDAIRYEIDRRTKRKPEFVAPCICGAREEAEKYLFGMTRRAR